MSSRRRRMWPATVLMCLLLVAPATPAHAVPDPAFEASISDDYVGGWGFAAGSSVTVEVRDAPGGATLASGSASTDGDGRFSIQFGGVDAPDVDFAPGMFISVSVGPITKELTLVTLSIDVIDTETDKASGKAPPNTTFNVDTDVCPGGCGDFVSARPVVSNGSGDWTADFGARGVDLVPGNDLGADISDDDGDQTVFDQRVPGPTNLTPHIRGCLNRDFVDGYEFTPSSSVNVQVFASPGRESLFTGSAPTDKWGRFFLDVGVDLVPGMAVEVTDDILTKDVTLVPLTVEVVDPTTDTVSGTATLGALIDVGVGPGTIHAIRSVTADESGAWTAHFAGVFDIRSGETVAHAYIRDGDGDSTMTKVEAPYPTPLPTSLSLESSFDTDMIGVGEEATFTARVSNDGQNPAEGVEMSLWLGSGLSFVSATSSQGTCGDPPPWDGGKPAGCSFGDVPAGETVSADFVLKGEQGGRWDAEAAVRAFNDPNQDNYNSASIFVGDPNALAHLSGESSVDTDMIGVGEEATFTATVHNEGPNPATSVEMALDLDSGLSLVSTTPSQGICGDPPRWEGGIAGCYFGDVPVGETVSADFILRGEELGEWYAYASVRAVNDPHDDNFYQAIVVSGPVISARPGSAPVGWTVDVEGLLFGANEPVSIALDGDEVGTTATDADGSFTTTFTVPEDSALGDYTLSAAGEPSGSIAETVFTVLETAGPNVYRTAVDDLGLGSDLDPTSEYSGPGFSLLSQMLVRTLVTFRHVAGAAGEEVVPDLATDLGTVSDGGLTYTFTLKPGVRFGPPLDRPITSSDIAYAFRRAASNQFWGGYGGSYYEGTIEGFATQDDVPDEISGIKTPNPQTIVFDLTQPTGDFLLRLAMPAAGPIPEEVAGCFHEHGEYGRYLVSSGPYMIRGADEVDASSCGTLTPTAGWRPGGHLELVRNTSYDPNTDSPEARENLIDGLQVSIGMDPHEIFQQIQDGELDGSLVGNPPKGVVDQYLTDPDLAGLLHADPVDGGFYITMNLLVPPFDDVNVRRAVNLVMDKSAMQDAWGGETYGDIATNVFPPAILPETAGYDPYPDHGGNLVSAKAEMAGSAYDTDGDGLCDDPACQGVVMVTRNDGPFPDMAGVIEGSLATIGIHLDVRQMDMSSAFSAIFDASSLLPIAANPSWYKDYPDPYTFARFLFDSDGISCAPGALTFNYALVGMTEAQAIECGAHDEWSHAQLPSVDADIDACQVLEGDDRSACWADLNHTLMEDVVPWVPFKWDKAITVLGKGVTHYEFDQFGSMISLVHISLGTPGSVTQTLPAGGGTVTTDPGGIGATFQVPIQTTVTSSVGGTVDIQLGPTTEAPPPSYTLLSQQVTISAPDAPAAGPPLEITFSLDASLHPDPSILQVARNGVLLAVCDEAHSSLPCAVIPTSVDANGDLTITVYTMQASTWNFAVHVPFSYLGFFAPVDNRPTLNVAKAGSAIPVRFSLDGDQGLAVLARGYPSSQNESCETGVLTDLIEQTVTAGGSSLTFDPLTGKYTYVWKTKPGWADSCRVLTVKLADGLEYVAHFKFKK